jgi:hypothetical protein
MGVAMKTYSTRAYRNQRMTKQPIDLPLFVTRVKKVTLDKNYCVTLTDAYKRTYKQFYGKGLPLWRYDLITESHRVISTEYIRSYKKDLLVNIKRYWTTVQGVKDL